jgi:hypothetical protein
LKSRCGSCSSTRRCDREALREQQASALAFGQASPWETSVKTCSFERDGVPTIVLEVDQASAYLAVNRMAVYRLVQS